jgi:aldehyde:ferredoxin oxidoreductase
MNGYMGKALLVNLSTNSIKTKEIPLEWYKDYLGGEGLGVRFFCEYMDHSKDCFDAEAPIIFATGPLNGTSAPQGGRLSVIFRSTVSGNLGISNVGGRFAPSLKKAGYDLLMISGRATNAAWLCIQDDHISIEDASALWGQRVSATEDAIKDSMGSNAQVISIGPAGENLVHFACLMTHKHRAAGRGGGGAIFGSKNLKAIGVIGTKKVPVADPQALKSASKKAKEQLKAEPFTWGILKQFGTVGFYNNISDTGTLPTKNWQKTTYPESIDVLGYEAYHKTLKVKPYGCAQCPIACGRKTTIKEGLYSGESGGGPEYETLGAFGSKCLINDVSAVAKIGYDCNELGLDTTSAGQTLATAMEWHERNILTKEQSDGLKITWGNVPVVLEVLRKIAYREGVGDLLADGSKKAGERLGGDAIDYVFEVKGLEMASCGVRASKGEVVSCATSPRGADHLRPYATVIDAFGYIEEELGITEKQNPLEDGNKSWVKPLQELSMVTNLLGACLFASINLAVKASTFTLIYTAVTGRKMTMKDLLKSAERVINMERMVNIRFGFDRKDDKLPKRLLSEPAPDGVGKNPVVDLDKVLDSYYEAMGWDIMTGIPKRETLEELNLDWMI